MLEINIETLSKPSAYSVPQIALACAVAEHLKASVNNRGHFVLLEPPEKP